MLNQKLVFHVVIYESGFNCFVLSPSQIVLEEFMHVWCKQHGLRLIAISIQDDHLHLLLEQLNESSIQRTVSRLVTELRHWPDMRPPGGASFGFALFTVSFSMLDKLIHFVQSQDQHHQDVSLEEELTSLVDKNDVENYELPKAEASIQRRKRIFA